MALQSMECGNLDYSDPSGTSKRRACTAKKRHKVWYIISTDKGAKKVMIPRNQ